MRRLNRQIWQDYCDDTDALKALALLIFVKSKHRTSVLTHYTHKSLAKEVGIHRTTIKKLMANLVAMGMVKMHVVNGNLHADFLQVKHKHRSRNIDISKFSHLDYKSIVVGLQALLIVEVQTNKEKIRHQVIKALDSGTKLKEYKTLRKFRTWAKGSGLIKVVGKDTNGYDIEESNYSDNGISYAYIARKLKVGRSKVSEIVKFGEYVGLFVKKVNITWVKCIGQARDMFRYGEGKFTFCSNDYLYSISANTYSIPLDIY